MRPLRASAVEKAGLEVSIVLDSMEQRPFKCPYHWKPLRLYCFKAQKSVEDRMPIYTKLLCYSGFHRSFVFHSLIWAGNTGVLQLPNKFLKQIGYSINNKNIKKSSPEIIIHNTYILHSEVGIFMLGCNTLCKGFWDYSASVKKYISHKSGKCTFMWKSIILRELEVWSWMNVRKSTQFATTKHYCYVDLPLLFHSWNMRAGEQTVCWFAINRTLISP